MSQLSKLIDDIFGGGDDKKKKRQQQKKAQEAALRQQQQEAQRAAQEQQQRQQLISSGTAGAQDYFRNLGADPSAYGSDIDRAIQSAVGRGETDLSGIGRSVYDDLQGQYRTRNQSAFNQFAPTGFEYDRIADTADDQIIAELLGESRASGDQYIDNLFNRGVVTEAGAGAARGDLDRQAPGLEGLLQELGGGILGGGRQNLVNIADRGRMAAGNLNLGQSFDPMKYSGDIDMALEEFLGGLGNTFRAQAPSTLFDTSGLANIAGAAQGAGNRPFDPKAVSGGIYNQPVEEEEDRKDPLTVF